MYTRKILTAVILVFIISTAFKTDSSKFVSQKTHLNFFSHTDIEDITANNYKAISTLDTASGDVVFSVPMQSFEFKKALMQKHFNSAKFLDTKQFPKAKFTGKILNNNSINYKKDGVYQAQIKGDMTIKGKTKTLNEKGTITVKAGVLIVSSEFNLTLSDYGVVFESGKPSSNIAKTVKVKLAAEYKSE